MPENRRDLMGDLTKNISQHELDCKCGKCDVTIQSHEPVIQCVQKCCDYFEQKYGSKITLKINSAARCYEHNRAIGSNDSSQHPRCSAMDVQLFCRGEQISPRLVYEYFDSQYDECGIGLYSTFTHFDTRAVRARWGV
jgi:zinc D-Ala-D-Ala carboxypeptidase